MGVFIAFCIMSLYHFQGKYGTKRQKIICLFSNLYYMQNSSFIFEYCNFQKSGQLLLFSKIAVTIYYEFENRQILVACVA